MTLQMRPMNRDGNVVDVRYAPARDICYLYPNVVQLAEQMLYDRRDPDLAGWLDATGVDEETLAMTVKSFCEVLNEAHRVPEEDLYDVMDRVGFSDQPAPAKIALTYFIGTLMAGTFFNGIREVVERGHDTTPEVQRLAKTGARMAAYVTAGPFRRRWLRFKYRWFPSLFKPWFTIGGKIPTE